MSIGTNYLLSRANDVNVIKRKVIIDKFPLFTKIKWLKVSGPFGHPESIGMCVNCENCLPEFSFPIKCDKCNYYFK